MADACESVRLCALPFPLASRKPRLDGVEPLKDLVHSDGQVLLGRSAWPRVQARGRVVCAGWPGHEWWYAAGDCQVDCQPFALALLSLDRGGRPRAADLPIWTAMDRPGQAGESYESASPRSARPTATATAAEPAPGSAGRSHRPRRTISAGPEPHLLAFDRRQSDNVGDIPRSGRCLPIRTCGAAALDSAAHPRLCADSGSSDRGGEDGSPDPGSRWPVRPDPTAPRAIAWLRWRDWAASNRTRCRSVPLVAR